MNMPDNDNWRFYGYPTVESEFSDLDTKRWGISTYRTKPLTKEDLRRYPDALVIARIDGFRLDLVQHAERIGFFLCDVLTYWRGTTGRSAFKPLPPGYWARPFTVADKQAVYELALETFDNYPGHYHNDPRLDKKQATEVYAQWASEWTGSGIVIEHEVCEFPRVNRKIVAFGTFADPCELLLAGVSREHAGQGLYSYLVTHCMEWGFKKGQGEIEISTQVTNLAVQKVWARHGLTPHRNVYTLHRWP